MNMTTELRIIVLALLTLLAGCGRSAVPPAPDPTIIQLYCDLALIAGDTGAIASETLRNDVFERHGITPEEFEEALRPFRENPQGWMLFFGAVVDTLEARVQRTTSGTMIPRDRPRPPDG